MKYCQQCLMPLTRPGQTFDEAGVCNACNSFSNRKIVDWDKRKEQLDTLLEKFRSKDGSNWDCIIPVSGGKDSTYQVIKMLELGMNPLCVTATTCDLSEIGRKNISNLQELGVDYIEITTNRKVRKKLNRLGLIDYGDISLPEHMGIFTIPVATAVRYNVPLIVWGENSFNEYGGPSMESNNFLFKTDMYKTYSGTFNVDDKLLVEKYNFKPSEVLPFVYPSNEEIERVGVTAMFLGYFLPWDGLRNTIISTAHGFRSYSSAVEGSCINYENVDNYQTGIHDYFKYLKFGFGRTTDLVCSFTRRNIITRNEGVEIVKKNDGKFPWIYLGKPLSEILEPLDISVDEFIEICDKFTNKDIFKTDSDGNLIKDRHGNLSLKFEII